MDPEIPEQAFSHELENLHLTFPETVQKQRNPGLYENTSRLHTQVQRHPVKGIKAGR
jgi:hypothetical protein